MKKLFHFVTAIFAHPWACRRETVEQLMLALHENSPRALEAAGVPSRDNPGRLYGTARNGSTAVIPIQGVIVRESLDGYPAWIRSYFTSTLDTERAIRTAMDDQKIERLLLDIDSPGGSVYGVDELSNYIRSARSQKPIAAYAGGLMASAAYYIGSAASKVYIGSGAEIGSIGVYSILQDSSKYWTEMGVEFEMIRAGKFKGEGHPALPITDATRKVTQDIVDAYYAQFVKAVSANRNLPEAVAAELADGRTHIGQAAVDAGLGDLVGTFNEAAAPFVLAFAASHAESHAQPCDGANSYRAGYQAHAVPVSPVRQAGVSRSRLAGKSRVHPAEKEDIAMSTPKAEGSAEVMPGDIKVSEATFEDVKHGNDRVFKQIADSALRDEKARVSGISEALTEAALPADVEGKVSMAVANMSVAAAKTYIATVSAIEGALAAGELQGLDKADVKCLRADIEGMGQLAAVRQIQRAVDAKKGQQSRLANHADPAVTGKDPEVSEEDKANAKAKANRAEAVAAARADFKKVDGLAGISERVFVEQILSEKKVGVPSEELDELLK